MARIAKKMSGDEVRLPRSLIELDQILSHRSTTDREDPLITNVQEHGPAQQSKTGTSSREWSADLARKHA
jgi:hypothetical protein